jgi:hypothetical protein
MPTGVDILKGRLEEAASNSAKIGEPPNEWDKLKTLLELVLKDTEKAAKKLDNDPTWIYYIAAGTQTRDLVELWSGDTLRLTEILRPSRQSGQGSSSNDNADVAPTPPPPPAAKGGATAATQQPAKRRKTIPRDVKFGTKWTRIPPSSLRAVITVAGRREKEVRLLPKRQTMAKKSIFIDPKDIDPRASNDALLEFFCATDQGYEKLQTANLRRVPARDDASHWIVDVEQLRLLKEQHGVKTIAKLDAAHLNAIRYVPERRPASGKEIANQFFYEQLPIRFAASGQKQEAVFTASEVQAAFKGTLDKLSIVLGADSHYYKIEPTAPVLSVRGVDGERYEVDTAMPVANGRAAVHREMMTSALLLMARVRTGIPAEIRSEDLHSGEPSMAFANPRAPTDTVLNHCEVNGSRRFFYDRADIHIEDPKANLEQSAIKIITQIAWEGQMRQHLENWSIPHILTSPYPYPDLRSAVCGFAYNHVASIGAPNYVADLAMASRTEALSNTPPPPGYTIVDLSHDKEAPALGVIIAVDHAYQTILGAHPGDLDAQNTAALAIRRAHSDLFDFLDHAKFAELVLCRRDDLRQRGIDQPVSVQMAKGTTDGSVLVDSAVKPVRPGSDLAYSIHRACLRSNTATVEAKIHTIEKENRVKFDDSCRHAFAICLGTTDDDRQFDRHLDAVNSLVAMLRVTPLRDVAACLQTLVRQAKANRLWSLSRPRRPTFPIDPNPTQEQLESLLNTFPSFNPTITPSVETLWIADEICESIRADFLDSPEKVQTTRDVLAQSVLCELVTNTEATLRTALRAHTTHNGRIQVYDPENKWCGFLESIGSPDATIATRLYEAACALTSDPTATPDSTTVNVTRLFEACKGSRLIPHGQLCGLPHPRCPSWDAIDESIRGLYRCLRTARCFHGVLPATETATDRLMDFSLVGEFNHTGLVVPVHYVLDNAANSGQCLLERHLRDVLPLDPTARLVGSQWLFTQPLI